MKSIPPAGNELTFIWILRVVRPRAGRDAPDSHAVVAAVDKLARGGRKDDSLFGGESGVSKTPDVDCATRQEV